ncbi:hypothetical protein ONZ45_g18803 [Pleurotus djamor]|nr:hypothetical protein ONZ45_g18803 [Pleurotus djamor]
MDVTLCAGERVGSGCRSKFPYKEDAGLCCWCLTLSEYDPQSEEWKRIKSLPRCLECGAFGENIEDECCGSCRKKNKELRHEESAERHNPVTHDRAQVFLSQMNAGKQRQSQVAVGHYQPIRNVSTTPSIPLTNKSLHAMRSQGRSASASRQFTVCVTPMVNGKISTFLGGISSSYSSNSMMGDILQATLDNFNLTWVTRMPANLTRDDVLLRWHGNRRFEEGEHGSVGELYDYHRQAVHSASYLDKLPPQWKTIRSGSSGIPLCFEVHIDTFKWESRTGCVVDGAFGPEPKRKRGAHSQLTSGKPSKRGRVIEGISSSTTSENYSHAGLHFYWKPDWSTHWVQ